MSARSALQALVAALALAGCLAPAFDADFVADGGVLPPTDRFRHDAGVDARAPCPSVPLPGVTTATVSVTTTTPHGRYSPRNVGAIWIEDGDGFVRTLAQWGIRRRRYLTRFLASSAGNLVDAVTSATLTSHVTHTVVWDLLDGEGCPVPDGDYLLDVELTDRNAAGPFAVFPFTFPTGPAVATFDDVSIFHDVQIAFE